MAESTWLENTISANATTDASVRDVRNLIFRRGFALSNFSLMLSTGRSSDTYDSSTETASAIRNPHSTLNAKKNMKGMSLGLMNACPSKTGCVLKRSRIPQAVHKLNQRLVSQYRHNPVSWKVMKYV